jgi:formyltetrahydrofolate deformylase
MHEKKCILTASCPNGIGIVAAITNFLADRQGFILKMNQFDDTVSGKFFIRVEFALHDESELSVERLNIEFATVAQKFDLQWELRDASYRPKVLIMVSKFDHCLNDLLYRWRTHHLAVDIVAIVSNHSDLENLALQYGIPWYLLPVNKANKASQESRLLEIIEQTDSELVILARYMQILSDDLCKALEGRAMNIHHSLLPGFKGAKPYHQAYDRGVKMVGATAHYVTADLDEGPIIEQRIIDVDHSMLPEELVVTGRDVEAHTLAKAVKAHCERRVFLNGGKTIVFR